jgi:transcription initiation factor TFIIB
MTNTGSNRRGCPACGTGSITHWEELGSYICDTCSYVFDPEDSSSDVPPSLSEPETETNSGTAEQTHWQEHVAVKDNSEANLVDILSQSEEFSKELDLPQELEIRTAEILTEAWKSNFMHGRNKTDTIAGTLYTVSREKSESIPPGIISRIVGTNKQAVKNTNQKLTKHLSIDLDTPTPEEYVASVCGELGLPMGVQDETIELLSEERPRGGNPVGIAAAGIYVTCNQKDIDLTLREVATTVNMTKETVWRQKSKITED